MLNKKINKNCNVSQNNINKHKTYVIIIYYGVIIDMYRS